MTRLLVLSLAIALTGCAPRTDHAMLMDNIEHAVRLPVGALSLDHYARAYAKGPGNRVLGVYFIPSAPDPARCGQASAQDARGGAIASCPPPEGMSPNARRWFDTPAALPRAKGSGCAWIDLRFNVDTHRVETVACHGDMSVR